MGNKRRRRMGKWARIRAAVRFANHWKARWEDRRRRWQTDPRTRETEMAAIFQTQKAKAKETRSTVRDWSQSLPETIHSKDLMRTLAALLEQLGHPRLGRKDRTCTVGALRVALIRYRLINYDAASLTWRVAKY